MTSTPTNQIDCGSDEITKGIMSAEFTPNDIAEIAGVSPKRVRSILRTLTDDRANRGGSWVIDEEMKDAIIAKIENPRRVTRATIKR